MAAIAFILPPPTWAEYVGAQYTLVPIERVLTNLAKKSAEKPKDSKLKFNLARAYAMAYAEKAEKVPVQGEEIWYGYEPSNVPFINRPTRDKAKLAIAKKNLAKAIETYEQALKRSPYDIVGRLGYAWSLDQAGKKEAAIGEYRKVIETAWKKEADLKAPAPNYPSITAEAAGYLIPLLSKSKDATEITELRARSAKIQEQIPRMITPIAIPLANGLRAREVEDRAASVAFDADGSSIKGRRWTWIKPNAAWLVIDKQNSGKVDSALQMFGNVTFWMFWAHGYEPLQALDDNGDGRLRGKELAGLCLWHDANQNGVSERGEVRPLAAHGIVAISCAHEVDATHPDRIEFSPQGVTFVNGATRPTYDVRLRRQLESNDKSRTYRPPRPRPGETTGRGLGRRTGSTSRSTSSPSSSSPLTSVSTVS
jgi:tetratricopeptide (TPR) repeat protein